MELEKFFNKLWELLNWFVVVYVVYNAIDTFWEILEFTIDGSTHQSTADGCVALFLTFLFLRGVHNSIYKGGGNHV